MSTHLTAGQRALLEAELLQRQAQLDALLADRKRGRARAEYARELLQQDTDDASQREPERELDLALSDRAMSEVGEVNEALRRLQTEHFGLCVDCGREIPFDRLKAEPWALRCIACESERERAAARR